MAETATEITAAGYTNLAIGTAIAAWAYIEFLDSEASPRQIMIISKSDSRVTAVEGYPTSKEMRYTVAITGADTEIGTYKTTYSATSVTFAACQFRNTTEGDVLATDTFTPATISATGDTLTITISAGVLSA